MGENTVWYYKNVGNKKTATFDLQAMQNGTANPFRTIVMNTKAVAGKGICITVGDIDNDGDADVITGEISGTLRVWLNKGPLIGFELQEDTPLF